MSVRVNLLPREIGERNRARRQRVLAGIAAAGVVAALGGAYALQVNRMAAAEERLAAEEAVLSGLQSDLTELRPFDDLERDHTAADAAIATALGTEVSLAGVLQDVAAVTPVGTALTTLSIETPGILPEDAVDSVGSVTIEGMTIDGHAPGVEELLVALDNSGSLHDVVLSRSEVDDDTGAVLVNAVTQLDPTARTDRYAAGLPEVLR